MAIYQMEYEFRLSPSDEPRTARKRIESESPLDAYQKLERFLGRVSSRRGLPLCEFYIKRFHVVQGKSSQQSLYAWVDRSLDISSQTSLWVGVEDCRPKHVSYVSDDPDFPQKEYMDNLEYVGKVNMYLGDSINPVIKELMREFPVRPGEPIGPY